jgi:hypothetical protein
MQNLAPLGGQNLWHGPPLGSWQSIETTMKKQVKPMFQGLQPNLLSSAHAD